jgi:uncharacterized protein YndB with AHSA1/START domain
MKRDVRIERTYPHPPELVWRALTDRELIAQWLMPNDFRAEVGHRFTMRSDPQPGWDGIAHLEVLELDAPRRMKWSWKGGPIDTVVTFELEPAIVYSRPATKLVVVHAGFEGLPAVLVSFLMSAGSRTIYGRLVPYLLDRLAEGRTVENLRAECTQETLHWKIYAKLFAPILRRGEKRAR